MPSPKTPTGVVVVAERARRGWTQGDLSEALRVEFPDMSWSRNKVRRIEAGEQVISTDVLTALAVVFDLDYATLIEGYATRGGGTVTAQYADDPLTSDFPDLELAEAA